MNQELYPTVILAGGLATRLRPLTEKIPKSLIDINGEPFIAHQLRLLKNQNIKKVFILTGFLGDQIEEYVDNGEKFGLDITFSYDGPQLLGTAGAIKKALHILSDNFFVIYGDSYLPCNFLAIQQKFLLDKKLSLMSVYKNKNLYDKSNVVFKNNEITLYDKKNKTPDMQYIDYGLGLFNKQAFELVPQNTNYDLASLYQDLLSKQQLSAFEVQQRFYEVGSTKGIKEFNNYVKDLA